MTTCKMGISGLLAVLICLSASAQTVQEWQATAVKKYPDLGVTGSDFNKQFVTIYTERRKTDPGFFSNPRWPLLLADEIAAAHAAIQTASVSVPPPAALPSPAAEPVPTPAQEKEAAPTGEPQTLEYEPNSVSKATGLEFAKFRWWAPAGIQVRGVLILLPGRGGDGRGMAGNSAWQTLATELKFGILAGFLKNPQDNPYEYQGDPDGSVSDLINSSLSAVLRQTGQAVKNPPLVFWGHSAGANVSQQYMSRHAGRVIAAVLTRATGGPGDIGPGKDDVPILVLVGKKDKPDWVSAALDSYGKGRSSHALWTLALHQNEGHEVGKTQELASAHITAAVNLRLSAATGSLGETSKPKKLTEQSGWLGDTENYEIAAYSQFKGKKKDATWLINEAVAKEWQAYLKGP